MNFKHFISELKRRNVFKVATAYAIVGWLIIQIVTAIEEPLSLPDWFDTATIILVFIGFPIALIIAWAFELTPDGLKKSVEVEATKSVTTSTGKKLNRLIITVLSLAVVFLVINRVFFAQSTSNSNDDSEIASIAVLPFVDMSPLGDQEYFSDGLAEELLNVLAKENNIKVAGRTSSFSFKGKNEDIKKIGVELGVAHVLEGSVRKSGNKIRITAQLIKVEDGFHVWTETYDREYSAENLFDIQDEISQNVLKELKVKLLGESIQIKSLPTTNTAAYEAYLKGNLLLINRNPKDIEKAIVYFKQATTLDNKFAIAYARLAIAYNHLIIYGNIDRNEAINAIRDNADQAMILDNSLGSAFAALSRYHFMKLNLEKYKDAIKKAYELEPNNTEIVMWYANSLSKDDDKELKLKLLLKAYELDPLHPVVILNVANAYMDLENYAKAQEFAEINLEKNPEYIETQTLLIDILRYEPNGKLDEAFIEAYKANKKHPENLKVLLMLSRTALDLNLVFISEEVETKLLKLYPENQLTIVTRFYNNLYNNKHKEGYEMLDDFLNTIGWKKGDKNRFIVELSKFDSNEDYKEALAFIEQYHPIYLSDTLSIIPNNHLVNLANVSAIYKKANKPIISNRLRNLFCNKVTSNFKYEGDITKESNEQLLNMWYCAILNDDVKQAVALWNEQFFKRKIKTDNYFYFETEILKKLIQDTPEYKEVRTRVEIDLLSMRNNAIQFLKSENAWPKDMKK
jgi:TolB-like protein